MGSHMIMLAMVGGSTGEVISVIIIVLWMMHIIVIILFILRIIITIWENKNENLLENLLLSMRSFLVLLLLFMILSLRSGHLMSFLLSHLPVLSLIISSLSLRWVLHSLLSLQV